MELKDTLLADNLRKAPPLQVKMNYDIPPSVRRVAASVVPKAPHSAEKSATAQRPATKRNWWARNVDVHIVEEGRVILKSFQHGNLVRIHPHLEKPYGTNKGLGASRLPTLIPGDSITEPDRRPMPDAYDGGQRERILADSKRMYFQREADKVKSKGTRLVSGTSYRLEGQDARGKSY